MRIAVSDANIFIDLFKLELITHFFDLDIQIWTTEEVMLELYDHQYDVLTALKRRGLLFLAQGQQETHNFDFRKSLSPADVSILQLAHDKQAILLSGESKMRTWCRKHHIEVHGIIWVLQIMVDADLLAPNLAADALHRLLSINNWLPVKVCQQRIGKWRNMDI